MFSSINAYLTFNFSFTQQEDFVSKWLLTEWSPPFVAQTSLLSVFMAAVWSSCYVKQAVNQPDPCTTNFLRYEQVYTVHVCHSVLDVCSAHCHASLPLLSAAGFYKARQTVRALTFTDLKPPGTPNVCCCWTCTSLVHVRKQAGLCCDRILDFLPLWLTHSQATDTPEDRNNPVLLYNKMELGDLNANFTLEVESQVKIDSFSIRICSFFFTLLPLSNACFSWRYLTGVTSQLR